VAVGALLCLAGATTLASVKWGLKDDGIYCVAALLGARLLTAEKTSAPARFSS
jgi:hypothetical protein